MMNNIKLIFLLVVLFFFCNCKNPEDVKYSFYVAGHTYGKPGTQELGLCSQFKDKIEFINSTKNMQFGVLTGDIVRHASNKSWDAIDEDLKKLKDTVYFSRGNHDGDLSFFEKRYGKSYQSFTIEDDLHIILDSNIGNWNIAGEQLDFLKSTINSNASLSGNIFIYTHHIIWWNNKKYRTPAMNSRDRMSNNLTFWDEIFPFIKKTGKPVVFFAGDVGAFDNTVKNIRYESYSYVKKDNVTLITSGMGGGKKDNIVIADVLNNNTVKFRLIHLNGDDINGLGKLEDYKLKN